MCTEKCLYQRSNTVFPRLCRTINIVGLIALHKAKREMPQPPDSKCQFGVKVVLW